MEKINYKRSLKQVLFSRRSGSEIAVHLIVFFLFTAVALSYLYILIWCLLAGMRTHENVVLRPFEVEWGLLKLSNYLEVFGTLEANGTRFFGMLFNSLYFSLLGPFLTILVTALLAYATTRFKFPGSNIYYYLVIITMILPLYGSGGAAYKLHVQLKLINSYLSIITSAGGISITYLYFSAFFKSMSGALAEAAEIDGANDWQTFFKIILPQSIPLVGALYLLAWMGAWNDYTSYLVYQPKLPTLAVGIFLFNTEMIYRVRMDILFGACFLVSVPPIVLFACFNNILMSNVSLGGVKE